MRLLSFLGLLVGGTFSLAIAVKSQVNPSSIDVFQMPELPPPPEDGRILSEKGLVVSTQRQASEVGAKILAQGGNAVDAAVAIGYALAVTEPCCGNLGGGGFMLIQPAQGKPTFINFREKAPLAAHKELYLKQPRGASRNGYLAVATPGTVKGLEAALTQYGTLERAQVIAPAITLAEKGFVLSQGDVAILRVGRERLLQPNIAEIFGTVKGQRAGDTLVQKDLAQTLKKIAQGGEKAFYQGEIAENIVKASKAEGGILSLADFTQYTIRQEKPLICTYRGYEVITAPPPGGGLPLCQMLNILEGYPLEETGFRTPQALHWFLSAMFYGYRDRNLYLGDPDFVSIPSEKLLSKSYAAQLRTKIPNYFAIRVKNTLPTKLDGQTTHYSVVDRQGNAVAVTYTLNSYFGAGVMAPKTGFLLNNEMDDFTTKLGSPNQYGLSQGSANLIEPGKRPLSSMSPTIVKHRGRLFLVTGTPGGSTIITTILQVITNIIDYRLRVDQAVNSPRLHYQGEPRTVLIEKKAISNQVRRDLEKRGYQFSERLTNWGAAETILLNSKGVLEGVNDYRRPAGAAIAEPQLQKSLTR